FASLVQPPNTRSRTLFLGALGALGGSILPQRSARNDQTHGGAKRTQSKPSNICVFEAKTKKCPQMRHRFRFAGDETNPIATACNAVQTEASNTSVVQSKANVAFARAKRTPVLRPGLRKAQCYRFASFIPLCSAGSSPGAGSSPCPLL